jgi:SAM-dependent methyltransferase
MVNQNIHYKSKEIQDYYSINRNKWEDFYPSEKWVFSKIAADSGHLGHVLDVGCACGGLGTALAEQFHLDSYTGVDINKDAINWALQEQRMPVPSTFLAGDIITLDLPGQFDLVVSLSCADWNIETEKIIAVCWERVRTRGYLIISLRLTNGPGVNDIQTCYQYINFSGRETAPEVANYVVFNFSESLKLVQSLQPAPTKIGAYGYWGKPSATAVTPFTQLVFAVFYLQKGNGAGGQSIEAQFTLPLDLFI